MARTICLQIPEPAPTLSLTIPLVGQIKGPGDVALKAYNACEDARAFIQAIQPALTSFGLPLCILGCVLAITDVFKSEFPFVNPEALPALVEKCQCLLQVTPFSFCSALKETLDGINRLLKCIIGLMSDVQQLIARVAALAMLDVEQELLDCLTDQSDRMRRTIQAAFEAFSVFFDSIEFLFSFVGVAFQSIGSLTGDSVSEVVQTLVQMTRIVDELIDAISLVCP